MSAEQSAPPARVIEVRADSDDAAPTAVVEGAAVGKAAAVGKTATDETSEPPVKTPVAPTPPVKPVSSTPAVTPPPLKGSAGKSVGGLDDEVLTQIAQAKFEAQEDRLRDVARHTMSLLRDYKKLSSTDCTRRISEIRKALLRYEMQYIRAWEYQERQRRVEIGVLEKEAERCRQEAEEEGGKIAELRQTLEKEKRRRKRYEGYEALAGEVNRKKTRTDSRREIDTVTAEIADLQQQCSKTQAIVEQRHQRAQLLVHAVAELHLDLQREQQLSVDTLDRHGSGPNPTGGGKAAGTEAPPGAALAGTIATAPQPSADFAEVIS